jgi:hypothetical protein
MFWRKKQKDKTDTEAAESTAADETATQAADRQDRRPARPGEPAVFEFGKLKGKDEPIMQGVCRAEKRSEIPACVWRVTKPPADLPGPIPKYHIEF